jgi:hypothetical protein
MTNKIDGTSLFLLVLVWQAAIGQQLPLEHRVISGEEAYTLVSKALETSGATKLPGFALEQPRKRNSQTFLFFEATWDNPKGSVVIGHYAVDKKTGDVWNAIVCEELTSARLKQLQRTIRKRIGLSEEEYRKLRRRGPMCETP